MGETYRVEVPQRLPLQPKLVDESWDGRLDLALLRGCWFELSVIGIDTSRSPTTVQGIRMVHSTGVVLPLSAGQAVELGLPAGSYETVGHVRSVGDDSVVALPGVQTLTVPVRWLRALASVPSRSHRDASSSF